MGGSNAICFDNVGAILYAGTANGILQSSDNGETWAPLNGSSLDTTGVPSIVGEGNNLYAAIGDTYYTTGTYGNGIVKSTDNGYSWVPVNRGLTNITIRSLAIIGTTIFAGGRSGGGVFRSTDSGGIWSPVNNGLSSPNIWYLNVSGMNLYAVTDSGLSVSSDMGGSWKTILNGFTSELAVSGSNLIADHPQPYPDSDACFFSSDNGAHWSTASIPFSSPTVDGSDKQIDGLVFSGSNIFACTSDALSIIFLSTDSGRSWSLLQGGPDRAWNLTVSGPNVIVGSGDEGIWYAPLSEFGISSVQSPPLQNNDLKILPNPTTSSADFQFDALKEATVFELFDILGRSVLRQKLSAGQASLHVNMQNMPAGIYFARMGGGAVRVVKM